MIFTVDQLIIKFTNGDNKLYVSTERIFVPDSSSLTKFGPSLVNLDVFFYRLLLESISMNSTYILTSQASELASSGLRILSSDRLRLLRPPTSF